MRIDIHNTNKKYQIIYADPAWGDCYSTGLKNARGVCRNHYNTMTTEQIKKLPIQKISTDTSICFLWATFPAIESALEVIKSWGFRYVTIGFNWIKKNKKSDSLFWGMGQYTRANAEICLIGVSKNYKATKQIRTHKIHSVICERIMQHSQKPDCIRNKIIELCGDIPRIELFARQQVDGWDCWGNEV